MPSIRIHQNIFGFEKMRKGFTRRQIISFAVGAALAAGSAGLLGYVLGLPSSIVGVVSFVLLAIPIICGFMPIEDMPAEEFAARATAIGKRGNAIVLEGEQPDSDIQKGEVSSAQKKAWKRKGSECDAARKRG